MNAEPTLLNYVQAIGPVVVALIAALIAFIIQKRQLGVAKSVRDIAEAQAKIAEQKLKLDQFEKRFEVFQRVDAAIADVFTPGKKAADKHRQFIDAIAPVRYLFNEEMYSYLRNRVLVHIDHFLGYQDYAGEQPPDGDEYGNRMDDEINWLKYQHDEIHRLCGPFLMIDDKTPPDTIQELEALGKPSQQIQVHIL